MSKRNDTDKAINNIMNWSDRPEWASDLAALFDTHFGLVCERMGIPHEDLGSELGDHGYEGMLFGIVFEDLLSRRLPPDNRNIIDDYLQRRGWRESVHGRRYLQQLRDSVLCLYEVIDVAPGRYCDLHDLVRGGKTLRVHEHMGTQTMARWDRIAARVLTANGKHYFSGGILPFPRDASQSLLRVLDKSRKQFDKDLARAAGKESAARITASVDINELFLRDAAPAFTSIWLTHTLERLRAPLPEMVNRDGEALVFTETRFPIQAEDLEEAARRLDAATGWERESANEHAWIWLAKTDAGVDKPEDSATMGTFQDGHSLINGTLAATPGVLTLTTNSMERAERGKAVLETLLHGLVGPALSKLQTPEQMMAGRGPAKKDDTDTKPAGGIDPDIAAGVIHTMLDQHYRKCLDEPIPMLDNKTPRQCARSKKGREKVIDWLKDLENNEQHRAIRDGQKPYDSRWIWEELKLHE